MFLFIALPLTARPQVQAQLRILGTNIYDFTPIMQSLQKSGATSSPFLVTGEVFQINENGAHIIRKELNLHLSQEFAKELTLADPSKMLKMLYAEKRLDAWREGNLSAGEMMSMDVETKRIISEEIEREKNNFTYVRVLVTNCPNASALQGKQVQFFALPVGTYSFTDSANNLSSIPRYDYGRIYVGETSNLTVFVVSKGGIIKKESPQAIEAKQGVAAKKLLIWQLQQASNGVAYVQFDLAKRYLNGEGVKKDEALGHYWLQRSAEQDYAPAINLLKR